MAITFRIATSADELPGAGATITARQFAAFRAFLRAESARMGSELLDSVRMDKEFPADSFDARVCPLALATVAEIFDHATDVIAVVEEAQFRGRRVRVHRKAESTAGRSQRRSPDSAIRMCVSVSDPGVELDLDDGEAFALLAHLGLRSDCVGEIGVASIRARLANSAIKRRALADGLGDHVERLDRLLESGANDENSRLEWA
jgi:hypothetical protein